MACQAVAREASEGWLAEPKRAATSPPSPFGFGATAFARFAREGWWARQGSNL
jgi:hypothetical protein